jgi:hypothetical protein
MRLMPNLSGAVRVRAIAAKDLTTWRPEADRISIG